MKAPTKLERELLWLHTLVGALAAHLQRIREQVRDVEIAAAELKKRRKKKARK